MGYYDAMRHRVVLGDDRLSIWTKPGMVAWDEVEAAAALLASDAEVAAGMRVLLLENGTGALAAWAARLGADVHCYDGSLLASRMARLTLEANEVSGMVYEAACPPAAEANSFDVALLLLPKGRDYTRALLGAAYHALKPGGRLYMAGPNAGGAKAVVKDAGSILGRAVTIRTKARNRLAVAVKLAGAQGESPPLENMHEFSALDLHILSTPGVFSWDGLDAGTAFLLDSLSEGLVQGSHVLDIGCGYGVIGMYAARLGAAGVEMVDSSWLAVSCAQQSVRTNGLEGTCRVAASDLYADVAADSYDLILSNPPFHAGHAVETEAAAALIAGARQRLSPRGRLRIVANVFLGYDTLMQEVFGRNHVSIVAENNRYRVLEAKR